MKPSILSVMMNSLGSTYYRQFVPMRAMAEAGLPVASVNGASTAVQGTLAAADIVHLSRLAMKTGAATDIIKQLQGQGKRVVIDYDDDLLNLPLHNPSHAFVNGEELLAAITAADGITVTNAALAAVYRPFAKRIEVVPNFLDLKRWPERRRPVSGQRIVIGLTGSPSHVKDWEQVAEPLRMVKELYGDRVYIFLAGYDAPYLASIRDEYAEWSSVGEYHQRLNFIDIGLCPLVDDEFNRRKTPIKAMELGATDRAVVIASPVQYREMVSGERGFIARTEGDWVQAMVRCIEDVQERQKRAKALHRYVASRMDVKDFVNGIYHAIVRASGSKDEHSKHRSGRRTC